MSTAFPSIRINGFPASNPASHWTSYSVERATAVYTFAPTNKRMVPPQTATYFLILLQAVAAPVTSIAADPSSMC